MDDKSSPARGGGDVRKPPACSKWLCRYNGIPGEWVRRPTAGGWAVACWCAGGHFIIGRGAFFPKAEVLQVGQPVESLRWLKLPGDPDDECARCGRSGRSMEEHHWAPRAVFDDADCWPTSKLCADCHKRWHAAMGWGQR